MQITSLRADLRSADRVKNSPRGNSGTLRSEARIPSVRVCEYGHCRYVCSNNERERESERAQEEEKNRAPQFR